MDNPCYPRNYNTALTVKYFCGSLCTQSLRPANYYPNQSVSFRGTGDPGLCQEMVSLLFNLTACRNQEDCPFDRVHQPKVKGNFVVGLQTSISSLGFLAFDFCSSESNRPFHLLLFHRLSQDSTTQLMLWIYPIVFLYLTSIQVCGFSVHRTGPRYIVFFIFCICKIEK